MNNTKETRPIGFSAKNEKVFLDRLSPDLRRQNLEQELKTQLTEDFGLVEFTLKYKLNTDGRIVDLISGQELVDLTSRGGVDEEIISIKKIESDLTNNPQKICIHFSPKNEELGYPENCVDFWRVVDSEVIWNRMVVKNNFQEMNKIRTFLTEEKEVSDEMEILKAPISVDLKLAEVFSLFQLNESNNSHSFDYIERIVARYLSEFHNGLGEKIINDSDSIFRLYSACFNALKYGGNNNEPVINRKDVENYMYGVMNNVSVERSYGCGVSTTVGSFGEKVGYYVSSNGEVKHGKIPEGFSECGECGCWYSGNKCPFC